MAEQKIGSVSRYFGKIGVAAVEITAGELRVGDTIRIKGKSTDFVHQVTSMQMDKTPVEVAKAGEAVGLKVAEKAREHDEIFKITEG